MRCLFILLFAFSLTLLNAQPALHTKSRKAIELYNAADNFRVRGQYKQAIDILEQAIEKDKNFIEAYFRLGQTYKSFKQYSKSIEYFEKGMAIEKDERINRPFWYELGEVYFLSGNYDGAAKLLNQYIQAEVPSFQNKARFDNAKKIIANADYASKNQQLAKQFNQQSLSDTVNCFTMQYFPVLTADQQILIYTRREGNNNTDDEDIVVSRKDERGRWLAPVSISKNINTSLNEGTSAISADGRKLIFTSCVGRDGWGSCDLYESNKIGEQWSEPKNLGPLVNSSDWESQPSLSADGRTIYFVSDRRGGVGRRDIWISTLDAKGNWTRARNLGKEINTINDEISPFIHVNNSTLYFATNGLTGFGGYDIHYSVRDNHGKWSAPVNMGAPINNHEDQFSLFVTADGEKAFYSHETLGENGQSFSKLYEVVVPEPQRPRKTNFVKGFVTDKETGKPLLASVELINIDRDTLEAFTKSDSISGAYLMVLAKGSRYALYINKRDYLFKSLSFDFLEDQSNEPITINIELEKIRSGSVTVLNNIFFEFDSYELTPNSLPELDKVVRFLLNDTKASIEIGGHTDATGSNTYNQQLSEKRANTVATYLIKKGIPQKRVFFKGYGSSKPVAPNTTEMGQKMNRRIEFRIL
jgi:outer membrane protein OmpA-like peptidoglycan-associated protein/tetratricopeptide (TPR) repeat protein